MKYTPLTPQVKIAETDDAIYIDSPFSASNNEKFRSRGGQFDRETGRWKFPKTEATTAMIEELFGAESELVSALVPKDCIEKIDNQWQTGGYVIANRRDRDTPVKTAQGVQVAKGNWCPSGGSVANPRVTADDDLEIHVVVRKSYADRENLEIIAHNGSSRNPLENYSQNDLLEELQRRGLQTKHSPDAQLFGAVA